MSVSTKYSPFSKKRPKSGFSGKSLLGSYAFPVYSDCTTTTTTGTIYYASEPTLTIDETVLYTDAQLTTTANEIVVILKEPLLDNGVYITTSPFGIIDSFARCNSVFNLYDNCGNNGGPTSYYMRYNDGLANGNILYDNDSLTTPSNGITRSLDYIVYTTDANGVISTSYCTEPIITYVDCSYYNSASNPLTLYVRAVAFSDPLIDGTKVYTTSDAITEISSGSFAYNGNLYNYTSGVGTSISNACST